MLLQSGTKQIKNNTKILVNKHKSNRKTIKDKEKPSKPKTI